MDYFLSKQFFTTFIIIVVALSVWRVFKNYIANQKVFTKNSKNIQTKFVTSVVGYILLAVVVVTILEVNGVDVSSLVAGLGIVGIVVGFALQDFLKDIVAGINIVWNNLFKIGDVIKYEENEGEVFYFSLRITKINDIKTGNIIIISNRNVSNIEILSKNILIDLPTSYNLDANEAREVMLEIVKEAKKLEYVEDAEFNQTSKFDSSAILYRIKVVAPAKHHYQIERNTLALVQDIYKKHNITIPYNQLDVHLDKK